MKDVVVYKDEIFTEPRDSQGNILILDGNKAERYEIINCAFHFSPIPYPKEDEFITGINGAHVVIKNCIFLGGIKPIMCGNGDSPCADISRGRLEMERCFLAYGGRRCPEVKHGVTATMRDCWLYNWGATFDTRAFGAWATDGGRIAAEHCVFTQYHNRLGLKNSIKDIANHVGDAVNRKGILEIFKPRNYKRGIYRALTATDTGLVFASKCYRNDERIIIQNCEEYIDYVAATDIVARIADSCSMFTEYFQSSMMDMWWELR